MATFKVTGPDGAVYRIEAPDENALNEAVDQLFSEQPAPQTASMRVDTPAGPQGTNGADPMAPASYPQEQFGPPMPAPPTAGSSLRFGAQAVGEGLASVAGFPVDAATAVAVNPAIWLKNQVFGGETPMIKEPFAGSEFFKERFVRPVAEATGGAVDPEQLGFKDRAIFEGLGAGTGAIAGGLGMLRQGVKRGAEIAGKQLAGEAVIPKAFDAATKTYADAPVAAITRDAIAGFGSGVGLAGSKEMPESVRDMGGGSAGVISDIMASLLGGVGAVGTQAVGGAVARQGQNIVGRVPFLGKALDWNSIDNTIPVAPDGDLRPYSKRSGDIAGEIYQGSATRPETAGGTMEANRADLQPVLGERLPSPGALAEDPGIVSLEREMAMQDRNPTIRREQEFNAGIRDVVDNIAPQGDATKLQAAAEAEAGRLRADVDQRNAQSIAEREARIATVEGRAGNVDAIRQGDAAQLGPYQSADAGVNASRRLDEAVVDRTYLPDRAEKNRLYQEGVDPNTPLNTQPVAEAARGVAESAERLPPSIRGSQSAPALAEDLAATPSMTYGDAGATRQALSSERNSARATGDFGRADAIGTMQNPLNQALDEANPAAAQNYSENFAPKYRAGPADEMAKFTKEVDRDPTRSNTPPSETAARFLSSPEKIESLRRVLDSSPAGEQGNAAIRDHLLADMAKSGVIDQRSGAIRPDKLRAWRDSYGSQLDAAPGFAGEVDAMIARAGKGERVSGGLTQQVKDAQRKLRETERAAGRSERDIDDQINKGALGAVMNADPDKAVSAIMSRPESAAGRLKELADLTKNDHDAREGLKAAVRDYMTEKGSTTAVEKLPPGDSRGPLSPAKISKLFGEHEKALAEIYSPEEMNALRVVHKALDLQKTEQVRVTSGSDTAEKLSGSFFDKARDTPIGQAMEAVVRLKFGMLKGGGMIGTAGRYLRNMTPEDATRARELLQRAAFDPDLAMILATRKIPVGSPKYSSTIQKALAGAAGAREAVSDNEGDDKSRTPLEVTVKPGKP